MTYNWDRLPNESDAEYEARWLQWLAAWCNETGRSLIVGRWSGSPHRIGERLTNANLYAGGDTIKSTQPFTVVRIATREEYVANLAAMGMRPANKPYFSFAEVMAD